MQSAGPGFGAEEAVAAGDAQPVLRIPQTALCAAAVNGGTDLSCFNF